MRQHLQIKTQNLGGQQTVHSDCCDYILETELAVKGSNNKSNIIVLVTPSRNQGHLYYTQIWLINFHEA